ncbi:2,3-bisphosphoglycerate-independent phosphoglycerate mutase [Desulfocurvus sp. DL9XJH121]
MSTPIPTLLLILDGWGVAPPSAGNAVSLAETPNLDRIQAQYPRTELVCSGRAVGLPDGFMGNSEVGHMNIGAGRVVYQDMTRIDMAIEQGGLGGNQTLAALLDRAQAGSGRIHFMGLVSDSGVHSHLDHLFALLACARDAGVQAFVHVFLDGRDSPPTAGAGYVRKLEARMAELGHGAVASLTGRYWAMDRDKRWDRTKLAYDALTLGQGQAVEAGDDAAARAVEAAYADKEYDEFVKPRVMTRNGAPVALLRDGDAAFFFNFRADRARQLTRALFDPGFAEFERQARPRLDLATMTRYEADFPLPVAFGPQDIEKPLGEVVADQGFRQLRIAETEKYAHVTYFMNCGREEPLPGEDRELVPSPREVATYDQKPEMSVFQVTDKLLAALDSGKYSFIACNLANLDMVGHTGVIPAAVAAARAVDDCAGRIVAKALEKGGRVLLTADHGNAEEMLDEAGAVQTAHSRNRVPLVYIETGREGARLREGGKLGDIAPTILDLWGLDRPGPMTGESLLEKHGV